MIVQTILFETDLSEEEVLARAETRVERFRAIPGLLQKYYVKQAEPRRFGGIYVWDSLESLQAYRASDLAATISEAYEVKGRPSVVVLDVLFPLREMN